MTFDDLYRDQFHRMVTLAAALCRDTSVAEDLVQDAFEALHTDWERLSAYDDPVGWLRRVIANRAVSRWRRVATETRALARLDRRDLIANLPDPDREVWTHVRRLPRRQAQVIALTYLDDLSIRDVADVLKIDEPTVKTHLQRARRALAQRLSIDGEETP